MLYQYNSYIQYIYYIYKYSCKQILNLVCFKRAILFPFFSFFFYFSLVSCVSQQFQQLCAFHFMCALVRLDFLINLFMFIPVKNIINIFLNLNFFFIIIIIIIKIYLFVFAQPVLFRNGNKR